jgi:hypothetical protein
MAFFGRATPAVDARSASSFYATHLRPNRSIRFGFTQLVAKEKRDVVARPARIP